MTSFLILDFDDVVFSLSFTKFILQNDESMVVEFSGTEFLWLLLFSYRNNGSKHLFLVLRMVAFDFLRV